MNTTPEQPPLLTSRLVDKSPIHYAWVVLGASTVGMALTIPGQTVGVSVFLDSIIADLGLGRAAVSGAYTAGTLIGSLALPFVGRQIDRVGPRRAVTVIATLFALACAFMGLTVGFITLLVGFTLIRGLGQGALGLVSIHSINIWFVQRRGLAIGLAGLGFAAATAVVPLGLDSLVSTVGWRWAYGILGLLVAAVMLPVGGGLFRHRPERYGLTPDRHTGQADGVNSAENHFRLDEARRTITFWLYAVGGFLTAGLGTGLVFHHFSIMSQNGVARPTAALMFIAYGLMLAVANLLTGYLIDRMPPARFLSVTLGLMGVAMLGAGSVSTAGAVVVYGVVLGSMQGTSQAVQSTVYGHYFGRLHFGSIKGFASMITVGGSAAGPLLVAVGYDLAGSYEPVLALTAILPIGLAALAPFLRLTRDGRVR
ncbi:MAG: MFS transporter [Acidimicrobiia bacterium]|nr:MFS transporter [Acidimicrobiia bacterium]